MDPATSLVALPMELVEAIVIHLDFDDICNLRLACRVVSAKSSQGSFKTNFVNVSLSLSHENLRRFVTVTQCDRLGCALEHLTIVRVPPAEREAAESPPVRGDPELLAMALTQLQAHSRIGRLRSLRLSIGRPKGADLVDAQNIPRLWKYVSNTIQLVALALQISGIPIESIDLCGSVEHYALSCHQLQILFASLKTSELKTLSMGVRGTDIGDLPDLDGVLPRELSRFLVQTQKLASLTIRWYQLRPDMPSEAETRDRQFFKKVASLRLPSLTSVTLRGVYTTSTDLLDFLKGHAQLRQLSFEWLHLEQGSFDVVFAHINQHIELESLYLQELWESRIVRFLLLLSEGPFRGRYYSRTWIHRKGLATRDKIVYKTNGPVRGTARASDRYAERELEYGPLLRI